MSGLTEDEIYRDFCINDVIGYKWNGEIDDDCGGGDEGDYGLISMDQMPPELIKQVA